MQTVDTQSALPPDLMKRIVWRLAPLMVLMYVANQLDRANVGYAALTMNAELGMSAAQYGLSASLFFLGYILCEVPSNLCMHRFGARRWMTRILVSWGLLSSLTSFVPNAQWLYVARFTLGMFEAGLYPGMVYYLTLWMPARNRVWMMSLFTMSIPLTGMIGAPVSTWIMEHANVFGVTGWRAMILLEGLPAIVLGVVAWFYLPDNPDAWRGLSDKERQTIRMALAGEEQAASAAVQPGSARRALTNLKVWGLGLVYFGINSGIIGLLYFLPQVVKTFKGSAQFSLTLPGSSASTINAVRGRGGQRDRVGMHRQSQAHSCARRRRTDDAVGHRTGKCALSVVAARDHRGAGGRYLRMLLQHQHVLAVAEKHPYRSRSGGGHRADHEHRRIVGLSDAVLHRLGARYDRHVSASVYRHRGGDGRRRRARDRA